MFTIHMYNIFTNILINGAGFLIMKEKKLIKIYCGNLVKQNVR